MTTTAPNYDLDSMAKSLAEEAGLEWPDWETKIDNPDAINNAPEDTGTTAATISGETSETGETGETGQQQQQQTIQPPQPPQPPTAIKIGDRELPLDQAEALLGFQDYLTANPDKAQTILKIVRGESLLPPPQQQQQQQEVTPPPPPVIPDGFDTTTPRDKFILDNLTNTNKTIAELSELTKQQIQKAQEQALAVRAKADMESAVNTFRGRYDLTDDEFTQVRQKTAELNIVGGLVNANPNNPSSQIVKALEAGMWNVEAVRNKLLQQNSTQDTVKQRQSKLSKLNPSSSGSAPRIESHPRLSSDQEMKQAIERAVEPLFSKN